MKKLLALLIAVTIASSAGAVAVKVGYGTIAGVDNYTVSNWTTLKQTNASEDISLGLLTVGAEQMMKVNDMISVGMEITAGAPLGEYKVEATRANTGLPTGAIDGDVDDTTTTKAATAGVLAKASVGLGVGPGVVSVGLGVGTVIIGLMTESVDQGWNDNAGNWAGWSKSAADDTKADTRTTGMVSMVPVFCLQITPGFRMAVTETDVIGLEVPLSINSVTNLNVSEHDRKPADPDIANPEKSGSEIGGFSWGVSLVYTKKM